MKPGDQLGTVGESEADGTPQDSSVIVISSRWETLGPVVPGPGKNS